MPRRNSQLRQDYKPESEAAPARKQHLLWFLVGVGIPMAALAMYSGLSGGLGMQKPSGRYSRLWQ